jgi:hypothetical protein
MNEERRELGDLAAELARQLVQERFPEGPMTLEEMEEALAQVKRELGERLQRAWIERQEPEGENRAECVRCGDRARFCGVRERLLVSRHGEMNVRRRYYHCPRCHFGFVPLDLQLGLDGHATSPQVRAWVAELASDGAFALAVQRLATFTDVRVSESTAARITQRVGEQLRAEESAEAKRVLAGEAVPRRTSWRAARLHVSLDGTMAPLRDPWKRDGTLGGLQCRFGECKTAVCYETRLDAAGMPVASRRQYTATLEPVETFEKLVATLAYHCGSDRAEELAVLADGLASNWRIAEQYFPEAVQILDFYHATEHLWEVARVCWEAGHPDGAPDAMKEWVAARKEQLLGDQVAAVCDAIQALPAPTAEAQACRQETWGYFTRNQQRMRYRTFRQAGYQIASGVMEAACKTVVHQRLDQSGMHWRTETAEAVAALRANRLSDQPRELRPYCVGWN